MMTPPLAIEPGAGVDAQPTIERSTETSLKRSAIGSVQKAVLCRVAEPKRWLNRQRSSPSKERSSTPPIGTI